MARKGQEGVPDGYKRCSKCGEVKEVVEFRKGRSMCKMCTDSYAAAWRKQNKEHLVEYRKMQYAKYYAENKEKIRENVLNYRSRNKDKIEKYLKDNRNKIKEREKKYRDKNHEKQIERYRKYNLLHKDRKYAVKYFARNGVNISDVPKELLDLKMKQMEIKHAIKSHKEVTNG